MAARAEDSARARDGIRRFLASRREEQARFLAALVRIPSDNPPGDCHPHAEKTAALLEQLGFKVERYPVPEALVRENGMVSATNLVVRERFGEGPVIACNAHGDVVPPGLGWSTDPYGAEVRDGHMYGRGVAVSKSDFATYAYALLALRQSGARLRGCVELHFTYDEEAGGAIGPKRLIEERITKPDFAICAGFAYGVTTAHNGCLHLEVEVTGKSGHAADPEKGHDALEAAVAILSDLYAYRKALTATQSSVPGIGSPTLVVGLISGGINTNVVPDRVVFRLDRRIIPDENPADAERAITALVRESVRKMPGIRVNSRRILLARPFVRRPGQEHMVSAIARNAREVLGIEAKPHGVPLYTDARHYSETGVPTVLYGAGPRTLEEANGHRADERLKLDDLYKATEVVALSLFDLLEAQGTHAKLA
ncbi:MAG: M20/M25/M40 family metallo-hydrolase [Betaproteobacteria bacterium]|nr:M20/M25/M40 family metallo-hydrolase [Betaproteobacteria bacterium]